MDQGIVHQAGSQLACMPRLNFVARAAANLDDLKGLPTCQQDFACLCVTVDDGNGRLQFCGRPTWYMWCAGVRLDASMWSRSRMGYYTGRSCPISACLHVSEVMS